MAGVRFGLLILSVLIAAVSVAIGTRFARADVPPHYPGTICYTPSFWCWAQPPGPPGSPCVCMSNYGFAEGVRG